MLPEFNFTFFNDLFDQNAIKFLAEILFACLPWQLLLESLKLYRTTSHHLCELKRHQYVCHTQPMKIKSEWPMRNPTRSRSQRVETMVHCFLFDCTVASWRATTVARL